MTNYPYTNDETGLDDFDQPYLLDDPKHPDFADLAADHADMSRKRDKEDQLSGEDVT